MQNPLLSLSDQLASVVEQAGPAIAFVNSHPRAGGSGVHWRQDIIVTAEHSLRRDDDVHVVSATGQEFKATVTGRDPGTDLAVLKVDGFQAPVASLSSSGDIKPGTLALALGRSRNGGVTASLGIVSNVSGPWQTWRGGRLDRQIRLDLTVYPGSSGGALLDASGQVVGVPTAALSRNTPIAVPLETVNRVVDQLLAHGTVPRGFIGVGLQPVALPDHLKSKLNLAQASGLIVVSVQSGGPAEQGGIMMGDILLEMAGHPVTDTDDVQQALDSGTVGKAVPVRVVRGGVLVNAEVTVGQRPRRSC